MPNREHIELKTQFLIKGYYQVTEVKGKTCYNVSRLVDYLPKESSLYFEEPSHFVTTHWIEIK